jgi:phenylacetate-CoA ligase
MGRLDGAACRCGRGLPLLHLTGGRTTDFLTAINGQKVSGIVLATYGITDIAGIRQIQFVQEHRERITARVVKSADWSEDSRRTLAARVRSFLGEPMAVDVEFTDYIPLEASGKYRFSISRLPAA